jgi:hypothetical protein
VPSVDVRPFRRDDRDQLTELVNAHVGAVLPGVSVAVNTVVRQLERELGRRAQARGRLAPGARDVWRERLLAAPRGAV